MQQISVDIPDRDWVDRAGTMIDDLASICDPTMRSYKTAMRRMVTIAGRTMFNRNAAERFVERYLPKPCPDNIQKLKHYIMSAYRTRSDEDRIRYENRHVQQVGWWLENIAGPWEVAIREALGIDDGVDAGVEINNEPMPKRARVDLSGAYIRKGFTEQEVSFIQQGVRRFRSDTGRIQWKLIHQHYPFEESRTIADIKGKWQRIKK